MEELSYNERLLLNARIDELNALALAENLAELRNSYDERFRILENEIETLKGLVQAQSQMIGNALQSMWGSGSTVKE